MKTSHLIVSGLCILLASALGQAQSTPVPPSDQTRPQPQPVANPTQSGTPSGSSERSQPNQSNESPRADTTRTDRETWQPRSASTQVTGTETSVTTTTEVDPRVRTVIQEIDDEGPVVVERISSRFADVTCNEANARALIHGLHEGASVTLRGDNGQVATFTVSGRLGYGEAYIAMSLAVEALRQAGISGCATPAQWQAVLLGGELTGGTRTTTTISTARFPGILVLRQREGGWTKVAQTTHVELGQVVSQAHSTLQLKSANSSQTDINQQKSPAPTGHSSDYNPRTNPNANSSTSAQQKDDANAHSADANQTKSGAMSARPDNPKPGDQSLPPTGHSSDYNPRTSGPDANAPDAGKGNASDMDKKNDAKSSSDQDQYSDKSKGAANGADASSSSNPSQNQNSLTPTGHSSDYNPRQQDTSSSSDKSKADASSDKSSSDKSSSSKESDEEKKKREKGY